MVTVFYVTTRPTSGPSYTTSADVTVVRSQVALDQTVEELLVWLFPMLDGT